jgi:hypothetical protein
MVTIRNVVRWLAWQLSEHDSAAGPASESPARITVFSSWS